jgi:hypothetical protein
MTDKNERGEGEVGGLMSERTVSRLARAAA